MKIVGYMGGTNSEVMTNLLLEGYETIPLSNGWDNHGKYLAHINRNDNISLVVGYLHKFIPVAKEYSLGDMLSSLKIYKIPIIFIVPKSKQAKAINTTAKLEYPNKYTAIGNRIKIRNSPKIK